MPLLTFDQFETAVGPLLDEAAGARGGLPAFWRLGDQGGWGDNGPVSPLGHAVVALARIAPWVDRPLEPGPHYITPEGEPPRRGGTCAPRR